MTYQSVRYLSFRKGKLPICANISCMDNDQSPLAVELVEKVYRKYRPDMGPPAIPGQPNWIHFIPWIGNFLPSEDIRLIGEVTHFLYSMLHVEHQLSRGPLPPGVEATDLTHFLSITPF